MKLTITKEEYEILIRGMETRTRDNRLRTLYYCRKENLPKNIDEIISSTTFELGLHDIELEYEIMNSALDALYNVDYQTLKEKIESNQFDLYNIYDSTEFASCYIYPRLKYLNIHNQNEISEKVKEFNTDIQDACAMWYDEQVLQTINNLINKITK